MAKKAAMELDEAPLDADELLDAVLGELYTVVVAWNPGPRLVNILSIKSNGERIALDELDDESSWMGKLPPPKNGKFKITWAIVPKMPVTQLVIAVVNMRTGARAVVDTSPPPNVARNQLWENNKGVIVNAP